VISPYPTEKDHPKFGSWTHLKGRVGNPNIYMVLEYSQATGVVRIFVKGGTKY
jgi:hypothetical protein